ncbi:response regulator transcription factor [Algoriphagus sp. NF]|jgi:Response regulators consisting of a CheY-like receiver domain and a winged-helix DNA-binding domain|uniref:Response regulator transcription factor n=1 Tax=Algoriphagus marincola TaxID=264027 RepID=A0ABS7N3U0_9BACT|nr:MULTISPECIES: response regulator transcription factor [Algoriphagus]MBY5950987.1 response regulator transcription factor [Algoriphagus marincola]MCR9084786.1 response regulator transcription factor [Cyclobacteriaceae bacterium]MDE0558659.1 response regulator transcription factor [Algoriphagus sp. NF]
MRILIVEDEPGISNFLKQGLEEENFAVDISDNGRDGLNLALTGEYDLLLLDWMVPGISGIELTRQFRKEFSSTPIIFLTAKDTVDETVFGLQAGANDYIKKPFHFQELLERIRVQLRKVNQEPEVLTLGPFRLEPLSFKLFKEEKEIPLTQKEFALLEFLIRNKNTVCRRTRIIESVWDIHFEYNTGVIDVFINSLRKKLGITKDQDYIQTIRGVGYMAKE